MKIRPRYLLFPLIALSAFFAGCGGDSASPTSGSGSGGNGGELKVGLAGVQTGGDAELGIKMINGSLVAIDEWNAKGGVLGKKIVPVTRDDEGKADKAITAAQSLLQEGVPVVLGHFNSSCTKAASPLYAQNKILEITPGSTNTTVTEQGFTTLFRVCGRDDQQGAVVADFLKKKGITKIAILHNKTTYGQGLAEVVQNDFKKLGGEVVLFQGLGEDDLDFNAYVNQIKSSGAQAVFWGGMYKQASPFISQLRRSGSDIPFLGGDGCFDKELITNTGDAGTNVFVTFGPDYKALPSAQAFLKAYKEKFNQEEGPYSIYGYDAANVYLTAVSEAGTTDADKVAEKLRSKPFPSALGTLEWDAKGDLKNAAYVVWTIKDGKFVVLP